MLKTTEKRCRQKKYRAVARELTTARSECLAIHSERMKCARLHAGLKHDQGGAGDRCPRRTATHGGGGDNEMPGTWLLCAVEVIEYFGLRDFAVACGRQIVQQCRSRCFSGWRTNKMRAKIIHGSASTLRIGYSPRLCQRLEVIRKSHARKFTQKVNLVNDNLPFWIYTFKVKWI